MTAHTADDGLFQSTPPVKAATPCLSFRLISSSFQSTPPVKAATDDANALSASYVISIHAAREGGDVSGRSAADTDREISIHAAREGGDRRNTMFRYYSKISIHAAREGGDAVHLQCRLSLIISIHAAREGGDTVAALGCTARRDFNPRRP